MLAFNDGWMDRDGLGLLALFLTCLLLRLCVLRCGISRSSCLFEYLHLKGGTGEE